MTEMFNSVENFLLMIEEASMWFVFGVLLFSMLFAPINREAIIIIVALVAAGNAINPVIAFVIAVAATYLTYSVTFFVGRGFKGRVLKNPSEKTKKKIEKSYHLMEKYGTPAIVISYFVPGVRLVLPVIMGMGTMSVWHFLITSKIGSLIWTTVIYLPTYYLGDVWTLII